jgi:hypothetical protein
MLGYLVFVRASAFRLVWDFLSSISAGGANRIKNLACDFLSPPSSGSGDRIGFNLKLKAGPSSKSSPGDGKMSQGVFKIITKKGKAFLELKSERLDHFNVKRLGPKWEEEFRLRYHLAAVSWSERCQDGQAQKRPSDRMSKDAIAILKVEYWSQAIFLLGSQICRFPKVEALDNQLNDTLKAFFAQRSPEEVADKLDIRTKTLGNRLITILNRLDLGSMSEVVVTTLRREGALKTLEEIFPG